MASAAPVTPEPPTYVPVSSLRPGTDGHNLIVQVVSVVPVVDKVRCDGTKVRIALAILGDASGSIVFTARDDQIDFLKVNDTLEIRNARIEMFDKGFMRLECDQKWGKVFKAQKPLQGEVNHKNMSQTEYELVPSADNQEGQ